jgi:hypothetical protein
LWATILYFATLLTVPLATLANNNDGEEVISQESQRLRGDSENFIIHGQGSTWNCSDIGALLASRFLVSVVEIRSISALRVASCSP